MSADVSATTAVYGVIGYPVAHSLSPSMQNAAIQAAALDAVYVAFAVAPGDLERAVEGLRAAGVAGVNVTVPHKQAAAELCSRLTPEAAAAGAVNTISFKGGEIHGHNTDGGGFLRAAERLVGPLPGKRLLLLGAGGAARGVAAALLRAGAEIILANRTRGRAENLAAELGVAAAAVVDWRASDLAARALGCVAVVNASSAGMHGSGEIPLDFAKLSPCPAVIDLVYAPLETDLLGRARAAGCATQDGLVMLAAQGELAFEFWHGAPPPRCVMESALRDVLG